MLRFGYARGALMSLSLAAGASAAHAAPLRPADSLVAPSTSRAFSASMIPHARVGARLEDTNQINSQERTIVLVGAVILIIVALLAGSGNSPESP